MKMLSNILVVIGLVLLVIAVVGKFIGDPHMVIHMRLVTVIVVANTALLLAIITRCTEKK